MEKWFAQPVPGELRASGGAQTPGHGMSGTWLSSPEVRSRKSGVSGRKMRKGQVARLAQPKFFIAFIANCEAGRGLWKEFMTELLPIFLSADYADYTDSKNIKY